MKKSIFLVTLIMSVLLFTNNPIDSTLRLYQALWNTGHLFFFALLVWILVNQTSIYQRSWLSILSICLVFSVSLGAVIEILQLMVGRYMQWQDLFTDVLGGLLGFLAILFYAPLERRVLSRFVTVLLSVGVLLIAFYPVFFVYWDELKVEKDFPVIANFEHESELSRWDNKHVQRFEIDSEIYLEGEASALVEFSKGKYPDVSLEVIYPDWSNYKFLNINIHNAQQESLPIDIKIYDEMHKEIGNEYSDRFNYAVNLASGWNNLQISMDDVLNSPIKRKMDMRKITGFSLFLKDLEEPKVIHLDNIHLSN